MSRTKLILLLLYLFLLNSCNVHTFTFGEGPSLGYSKVIKQNNYTLGLISDRVAISEDIADEKNFSLTIKQTFMDGVLSFLSFGLYTPTTIIIKK
tara:strand:+ start:90 stop:374 length:285 start_codon:yes stop_codon:yes gene_type:complete